MSNNIKFKWNVGSTLTNLPSSYDTGTFYFKKEDNKLYLDLVNERVAINAGYADNAGSAVSAQSADSAAYATDAGTAITAGHATEADSATTAVSATSANYATSAGSATTAVSATSAQSATNANYAISAGSADSAAYATAAGSADSATTATSAASANYATSAGSAATADFATSAASATVAASATTVTSVVPITLGGTGAATAAQARTNLGIGTGATLSIPVPINVGGTSATSALGARQNLRIFYGSTATVPSGYTAQAGDICLVYSTGDFPSGGSGSSSGVTSVRVQATSPVQSSVNTAQTEVLNTTISLADGYGDTKNPYASKTAKYVLAAPNGAAGVPTFRQLVASDTPEVLPLTGGTLTGNLTVSKSAPAIYAQDTANNNIRAGVIVGSGHQNHGLYSNGYAPSASTFTSSGKWIIYRNSAGDASTELKLYGAVWNDYAEYRQANSTAPGRCVVEKGDDTLALSTERMQPGAEIISDTFGFAIGKTEKAQTPIAASGRVLAYPYESHEEFMAAIGKPVCSGPNGTVSIMTDEEYIQKGYCAIGFISAVPQYEEWGEDKVKVNGRVWIRVR